MQLQLVARDPVAQLRSRLRQDLQTAMRGKASDEVKVLRTLLGEIDNAEAIPVAHLHHRYRLSIFGDGSAEAPRRRLAADEIQQLLRRDRNDRLEAAARLEAGGKFEQASKLRGELRIVERYIDD